MRHLSGGEKTQKKRFHLHLNPQLKINCISCGEGWHKEERLR